MKTKQQQKTPRVEWWMAEAGGKGKRGVSAVQWVYNVQLCKKKKFTRSDV